MKTNNNLESHKTGNKLNQELQLTKKQVLNLIESFVSKNDPNDLFAHMLNTIMKSERNIFLEKNINTKNKANGYRTINKIGMHSQVMLQVPRDRLSIFKPIIMGLLNQQDEKLKELSYALYSKGLTTRQIGSVLKQVYGKGYSKSTVSRISQEFHEDIKKWMYRKLDSTYLMVMIDGICIKVKRDTVATESFYIVLGLNKSCKREILAIVNNPTESALGWEEVLRGLQSRGVKNVGLFVSDDLKNLDKSISKVFPKSDHQKCVVHLKRNLAKKLRINHRASFLASIKEVFNPDFPHKNVKEAVKSFKSIIEKQSKLYPNLRKVIKKEDIELYFTYLKYDKSIRRMIYTTNWIERFNKSIRRTIKIRNSLPSPHAALMLIGYVAIEAEDSAFKYKIYNFENDIKMNKLAND